ncbi:MAG: poly(R)-hydroxyalkanoic acid synthase subunit PhaE [Dehalococcoidia bacterium]
MAESAPRIPTPADFLGPWRQMAEQAEGQWNQYFNQMMGTETFANLMGRYMEGYLAFQQTLSQNLERYLQTMNLPTRTDIAAIGERIAALESQISLLTAEQQRLLKRLASAEEGGAKRGAARTAGNGA